MEAFFRKQTTTAAGSDTVCALSGREARALLETKKKTTTTAVGKKGKKGKTQLVFAVKAKAPREPEEENEERARKRFRESDVVARVGGVKIVRARDRGDVGVVDAALGASERLSAGSKAFAAVDNGAVVGAVVCEPASTATDGAAVDLGVDKIWVRQSHRRRGLATALLDAARRHFFFSFEVPVARLAVSQPTADGRALFTAYLLRRRRKNDAPLPLRVYDMTTPASP